MAKAKTAKVELSPDTFVVHFNGKAALEVRLISNVVVDDIRNAVNAWLASAAEIERDERSEIENACLTSGCTSNQVAEAIRDYEISLASCPLHTQTPELAEAHFRSNLFRALHDLLRVLSDEAYYYTATDLYERCRFPHHRPIHKAEDRYALEAIAGLQKRLWAERLGLPYRERRGGKARMIRAPNKIVKLAREYESLQNDKSHGDAKDKTLWEIVCQRFDNEDPKWRERAKLDKEDVPDAVLDLVPQRHRLKLKTSHLALYHAATRACIDFSVASHPRTGKPFLKPSPRTLMRRCAEATPTTQRRRQRTPKRSNDPEVLTSTSDFVS